MVHLKVQSKICLKLRKKVRNSSPKCNWDWKWQGIWNALENVLKNGLKGANLANQKMKVRVKFLVSSIVFEVIRTILDLFIFFLRKYFEREKSTKTQINDFHPLRSFCARKKLLVLLSSICLFLFSQLILVWFKFLWV